MAGQSSWCIGYAAYVFVMSCKKEGMSCKRHNQSSCSCRFNMRKNKTAPVRKMKEGIITSLMPSVFMAMKIKIVVGGGFVLHGMPMRLRFYQSDHLLFAMRT